MHAHTVKPLLVAQAVALVFTLPAYAQTVIEKPATELNTITVEAQQTTSPETTKINGQDLRRQGAQNMDDLVRYEAGVDVRSDNARIGHSSFNIRGITENQIAISVDDIPIPEANRDLSRSGSTATSGRDMVETDTLRTVSIQKSGDAAANGNGALGGSVNMQTYTPDDFLTDKTWHFGIRYGYRSTYRSHGATATLAGRHGATSGLLMLTRRNSHEAENYGENDGTGANRTVSNRQRTGQYNILAKANFGTGQHRIETAFEHFNRNTDTDRQDLIAKSTRPGSQAETNVSTAEDRYRRNRFSAAYRYLPDSGIFDEAALRLYYQRTQVLDYADTEGKNRSGNPTHTIDRNSMTQKAIGLRGELSGQWDTGYLNHRFKLALDYRRNQTDRFLHQDHYMSGILANKAENRYYPPSTRQTIGLTLQDRINFPSKTAIDLGLRFEHERTSFDIDQAYTIMATGSPTGKVVDFRTVQYNTLLPSVRLSHPFTPQLTAFAAYSKGFRSPAAINQAAGFGNDRLKYRVIPNFDLKPETAHNFEAGLIGNSSSLNWKLTAFHNRYKNLISEDTPSAGSNGGYNEFKFINANRAKTYGLELSGSWQFAPHWTLNGNITWMRGIQQSRNGIKRPLASAYPLHGSIGLEYEREQWGINTRLNWSSRQHRVPDDRHFRSPGYGVWDISAFYRPSRHVEMNLGIYNVGNKRYWTYADAARRPDNAAIDRYTQPGRNFAFGMNISF